MDPAGPGAASPSPGLAGAPAPPPGAGRGQRPPCGVRRCAAPGQIAAWRPVRRRLPRQAHGLCQQQLLVVAQRHGARQGVAVEPGADHRGQAGRGAVEIHVLRHRPGGGIGIGLSHRCRHQAHARMVGHVDQVQRRSVDEVLVTGDAAHVGGSSQPQFVRRRLVAEQALGQRHVDQHLLGIHGAGCGAAAQGRAVDAGRGPE